MGFKLDVVALTQKLVGLDTVNPPGNEAGCARYLGEILETAGFQVEYHESAPNRLELVAHIGNNDEKGPICLAGHLDTVPFGLEPWTMDPLSGEVKEGKLFGRGSSDMKGGIAAMVVAGVELADRVKDSRGISLVFVTDEETGCNGSAWLSKRPELLGRAGALIVGEPTDNSPYLGHKGAFWIDGVARGRSAHGSMPHMGENAILKAAKAMLKLENFDFNIPDHIYMGAPTLNIGTVQGGVNINSVPDQALFSIDIRTIPGLDHPTLLTCLGEEVKGLAELNIRLGVEGIWTDPSHDWIVEVFDILTPILGQRPEAMAASYFTDAGMLVPGFGGVPAVIMGPGQADMAHKTDEFYSVARLNQAVEAYMAICASWCGI